MTGKLVKRDPPPPQDLLQVIAMAVQNPALDVAKLEKLLDLQRQVMTETRKQQFAEALAHVQAKIPQIDKHGVIQDNRGQERNRYAKYEDIDVQLRPILSEEGFAVTFNEEEVTAKGTRYSCTLLHRAGHSDTKYLTLPIDASGSKNSIQGAGSTFSYARRYLLKAHLNLVEKGEDLDGEDMATISDDQAKDLYALLADAKQDKEKFLTLIAGADAVEHILARDYKRCVLALETKIRGMK